MTKHISPCFSCPWKVSTRTEDIPGGGLDAMKRQRMEANEFKAMGCHLDESDQTPCAGYVLQVGLDSLGLRLLFLTGHLNPEDYTPGDHELHADMDTMFEAHKPRRRKRAPSPKPILGAARRDILDTLSTEERDPDGNPWTASTLAEHLGREYRCVVSALEGLEKHRLITRKRLKGSKRRGPGHKLVTITEAGAKRLQEVIEFRSRSARTRNRA